MTVIEEYIEVVAADNSDATETTMLAASRPERILNCFAGPSLLAGLAVNHFSDHLPYYRLEDILQRSRLVIDRSTQCRWMMRLAKKLTPLTDLMRILALESPVVQADETPVKMLVPGQGRTSTTYLWAILGDKQRPYTTFSFTESRARAGPIEFFSDFSGTLVSDAYVGYECLVPYTEGRIRLAGCHAHARRKFEELHALGVTTATTTAMGYFQRLFDIEDELRELSDESRHEQRQLRSRPLLMEFKRWMDQQLETLRPKHNLRGAINYMTSRWECFERFLESGAIAIDNNASEQAVKNIVIGKKNWMFFGSPAGGHAAAVFYTLTATCRRLRIDPFAYLNDIFERLPQLLPDDQTDFLTEPNAETRSILTPLLPDQWLAAHPESQLQHRVTESANKSARRRTRRTQRRKALARATRNPEGARSFMV
jgi:transposase